MNALQVAFKGVCCAVRGALAALRVAARVVFLAALILAAVGIGAMYAEMRAAREGCGLCPKTTIERAPRAREA